MLPSLTRTLATAFLALTAAGCSGAQDAPAGDASDTPAVADVAASGTAGVIEARQDNFEQMKDANDALKREAEADSPDPAVFRENAAILVGLTANIAGGFPEGSGPQEGVETDALPEIWQNKAEFEARATALQDVLQRFTTMAAGNDMAATIAGVAEVGAACRDCHEQFRKRD